MLQAKPHITTVIVKNGEISACADLWTYLKCINYAI